MLKRSTLGLLIGAIALGGSVLWFEGRSSRSESTTTALSNSSSENSDGNENSGVNNNPEAAGEKLFPFAEADVEQVMLKRPGESLVFRKQNDNTWEMTAPKTAVAEDGAIAFLLNQLENPTVKTLAVKTSDLSNFGLAEPPILLDLVAAGKPYQLAVGAADFSGDKRYVRIIGDSPVVGPASENEAKNEAGSDSALVQIHVVSGGLLSAVERPTPEWLAPSSSSSDNSSNSSDPNSSTDPRTETSEPVPSSKSHQVP
ncbi:MAG: hypothetical protein DCF15_04055 [Phormidesmis priestleyi]|uniref:DUF4340 domain-containing protein n=1 Tax=Phormidesmis priestleyi TaxID=268141 RepID=A0A2W4XPG9_9CYAN|nr:MAG: hypothetical protein DCF15_04055 [Phormidesmis priestleyi]